jgi:hypothetical protein
MTMITPAKTIISSKASLKLAQTASGLCLASKPVTYSSRFTYLAACRGLDAHRSFSVTSGTQMRDKQWFPPPANAPKIEYAAPAWPHPVYALHLGSI